MTETTQPVLSDAILARCHERAPIYDEENRFFQRILKNCAMRAICS
jgi:hypothetical protein